MLYLDIAIVVLVALAVIQQIQVDLLNKRIKQLEWRLYVNENIEKIYEQATKGYKE